MKNNKGISLISVLVIVVVMLILASIAISGGRGVINNSKDSVKEEEIAAVKSAINKISLQTGTAGVFTPANATIYGTPAKDMFVSEEIDVEDWYVLDQEDLKALGLEYIKGSYVVNYKKNTVYAIDDFKQYINGEIIVVDQ